MTPTPTWFEYKIIFLYLKFLHIFVQSSPYTPTSESSKRPSHQTMHWPSQTSQSHKISNKMPCESSCCSKICSVLKEELRKVTLYAQHRTKCPNMLIRKVGTSLAPDKVHSIAQLNWFPFCHLVSVLVVSYPTRWSLFFIFGFLWWSSRQQRNIVQQCTTLGPDF